ncbi:hypothetical protein CHS0354_017345 [Potamilus streckersoni]|uniref:Polypeptide N-acetylgalactosaminyltransferase n=1 Tax=Potamilus streckersoni TaxID=2493646 RepID=A0AAE0T4U6_9BIVA|nr:hypothetical protein CHS0354_017345 [Potamilus streckersoni]
MMYIRTMVSPTSSRRQFYLICTVSLVWLVCVFIYTMNISGYVHYNHPVHVGDRIDKRLPVEPSHSKVMVSQNYDKGLNPLIEVIPIDDLSVDIPPAEIENNVVRFQKQYGKAVIENGIDPGNGEVKKEEKEMKSRETAKVAILTSFYPDKPLIGPYAPGEMGLPVIIDQDQLSPKERQKYDEGLRRNAFNEYASNMISLHRSLPDGRDLECKQIEYLNDLPDVSVVIIFHNEAWSVLLRTVHSVLDRSPPSLLKEIILVDDFSEFDHLKQPLDEYVSRLAKVSLIRLKERSGLIKARIKGFDASSGEVAIFLDSHCEATQGWLEPLLDRIARNETTVVVPVIDAISDYDLRISFTPARTASTGGFDWDLLFDWRPVQQSEMKRRNYTYYIPFRTPVMAGGLFGINRRFFEKLGKYDADFDIWGAENLELSFKTWMCGGTLETVPCSHVGHIYRNRCPYKTPGLDDILKRNTIRLAEVWLDEFKEYYYDKINNTLGDYGDVSGRKELRQTLNCKSFRWYLNNIYPELFIPSDSTASGEIRNKVKPFCADVVQDLVFERLIPSPCHGNGGNQYWLLSTENDIRRDSRCWYYVARSAEIKLYNCHGKPSQSQWTYRDVKTASDISPQIIANVIICIFCISLKEADAEYNARSRSVEMLPFVKRFMLTICNH